MMHFNYKDFFKAPRIAFNLQTIWANGIGLLAGYAIYLILTYLSLLIDGQGFSDTRTTFGLLPCGFAGPTGWIARFVASTGIAAFLAIFLFTNTAVCRMSAMALRRELLYSWKEAYGFAFRRWLSALGAMLIFFFMIAFFSIGALLIGLVGRLPVFGELGVFLLTIPHFLITILLIFILFVTTAGLFLVPAVIAVSDDDALGGVFQSFNLTFNQPVRFISYSLLTTLLQFSGMILLALLIKAAFLTFGKLLLTGMGSKFGNISDHGFYLLDKSLPVLKDWLQYLFHDFSDWIYLSHSHFPGNLPLSQEIAAYIFMLSLLIIGGAVIAYGEAIRNSGMTLIYIIL
ncbi:MAG: hypothetical protein ACE5GL_07365, partial [Calditrichia bacterium]